MKRKRFLRTTLYYRLLNLAEFETCDIFRELYIEILRRLEKEMESRA